MQHFSIADPLVKLFFAGFLIAGFVFLAVFSFFYAKYGAIVDRRMAGPDLQQRRQDLTLARKPSP